MVKKIISIFFMFIFFLSSFVIAENKSSSLFIKDDASIFTEEKVKEIEKELFSIYEEKKVPVYVFTTNEESSKEYRYAAADQLSSRVGKNNTGILLYINMKSRKVIIIVSGEAIDIYTDKRQQNILKSVKKSLKDKKYDDVLDRYFESTYEYINSPVKDNVRTNEKDLKKFRITPFKLIFSSGVGILSYFVFFEYNKKSTNPIPGKPDYDFKNNFSMNFANMKDNFKGKITTQRIIRVEKGDNDDGGSSGTTTFDYDGGSYSSSESDF